MEHMMRRFAEVLGMRLVGIVSGAVPLRPISCFAVPQPHSLQPMRGGAIIIESHSRVEDTMSDNRFGLVYRGAITENLPDQVNIHAVDYATVNGVDITANVYTPAGYSASSAAGYPVVVVHLNGGVKE
jgi:hypothetical protein